MVRRRKGLIMEMTNSEICRNYRDSKKKRAQITILAELNNTNPKTIKAILKDGGALGEKPGPKPKAIIGAADPVPGELGYVPITSEPIEVKHTPIDVTPREVAEKMFNQSRIREIIKAMNRYYDDNMAIPKDWVDELKERL